MLSLFKEIIEGRVNSLFVVSVPQADGGLLRRNQLHGVVVHRQLPVEAVSIVVAHGAGGVMARLLPSSVPAGGAPQWLGRAARGNAPAHASAEPRSQQDDHFPGP